MYQSNKLLDPLHGDKPVNTGYILASTDRGASWTELHDFGSPVVYLALDPSAPRIYASVVNRTTGGVYACALPTAPLPAAGGLACSRLAAPPRTEGRPYTLHALADGGLVVAYSGRETVHSSAGNFTPSAGVFYREAGADAWRDVSHPAMHLYTKDVTLDPHDASQSTWYAAVAIAWGPQGKPGGLWRTRDRGATWTQLPMALARGGVESATVSPDDARSVWVATEREGLWHCCGDACARARGYPFFHPLRVLFNPHAPGEMWALGFGNGIQVAVGAAGMCPPPEAVER